jgi:hypothetical protein
VQDAAQVEGRGHRAVGVAGAVEPVDRGVGQVVGQGIDFTKLNFGRKLFGSISSTLGPIFIQKQLKL